LRKRSGRTEERSEEVDFRGEGLSGRFCWTSHENLAGPGSGGLLPQKKMLSGSEKSRARSLGPAALSNRWGGTETGLDRPCRAIVNLLNRREDQADFYKEKDAQKEKKKTK